jgi:hypothetical protein
MDVLQRFYLTVAAIAIVLATVFLLGIGKPANGAVAQPEFHTTNGEVCEIDNTRFKIEEGMQGIGATMRALSPEDSLKVKNVLVAKLGNPPFAFNNITIGHNPGNDIFGIIFFNDNCMVHFAMVDRAYIEALLRSALGEESAGGIVK